MSPAEVEKCPNCGGPLPPGAVGVIRCTYCGVEVQKSAPAPAAPPPMAPPPMAPPPIFQSPQPTAGASRGALIAALVGFVVITGVAGAVIFASTSSIPVTREQTFVGVPPALPAAPTWDGTSPLRCGGNSQLSFSSVTALLAGTAINAGGNCQLTLVNCSVTADVAIEVMGNAQVTLVGGRYEGRSQALSLMGNGQVIVQGAEVVGTVHRLGNGTVTGLP